MVFRRINPAKVPLTPFEAGTSIEGHVLLTLEYELTANSSLLDITSA